jgi:hypothetical protein
MISSCTFVPLVVKLGCYPEILPLGDPRKSVYSVAVVEVDQKDSKNSRACIDRHLADLQHSSPMG